MRGGAWSPIGDVTTTMLWIDKKVTAAVLMEHVFIPSVFCALVPTLIASRMKIFRGEIATTLKKEEASKSKHGATMLYLGLITIIFVPIFKTLTHLPPYVGMMLSLAIVATFAEIYSRSKFSVSNLAEGTETTSHRGPVHHSLSKIELPSVLFFLGILMAVASLESLGMLFHFAENLDKIIPNSDIVVTILGFSSAVIDNVPLVAASMGMFSEPLDNPLWHFIAFSAGTGGSILVIGSAAGVVAMGMEKIDFFWYLKKIGILALVGFLAGVISFILLRDFVLNV